MDITEYKNFRVWWNEYVGTVLSVYYRRKHLEQSLVDRVFVRCREYCDFIKDSGGPVLPYPEEVIMIAR